MTTISNIPPHDFLAIAYIPFRTAVPLWGHTAWNLSDLSPQRDCSPKGVNTVLQDCYRGAIAIYTIVLRTRDGPNNKASPYVHTPYFVMKTIIARKNNE